MSKQTQDDIRRIAKAIGEMVVAKNIAYGDSAVDPVRIFSKADPIEQIKVRIDDKLSRFMRGTDYPGDNDIDDLLGYLILLKIAIERHGDKKRARKMTTYEVRVAEGNEPAFDVDVVRGEVGVNGYVNMLLDVLEGKHEVKTDYRAGETGNFYIEATSYDEQGEYDSGITVTKSTWWVQAAPNGQGFIIIKTDALKEVIRDTNPKGVHQPIHNSGTKASTGFLVKVADVVKKLFPSP